MNVDPSGLAAVAQGITAASITDGLREDRASRDDMGAADREGRKAL